MTDAMKREIAQKRELVDKINALQEQYDSAMYAAHAVDYRLDDPELPEPTPEEIAGLTAKAAAADREIEEQDYEGKIHDLLFDYAALNNGEWPQYNSATGMYMY